MPDDALPPAYPSEWEADVVLRDGSVGHVRPITPADEERIRRFHAGQSAESIYLRFFAPLKELSPRDLHRFTHVDYSDRVALVMMHRDDIIGIGRYDKIDPTTAEVAFNISDHYQGKGIGSVLLEHLADIGRDDGLTSFEAEVLPQNHKMLAVFADAGYIVSRRVEDGVVQVHFDIEPTEKSESVRLSREHRAESISISALLAPEVIAVVGAGRTEGSVGHEVLRHLRDGGFTGELYAVNPGADEVLGITSYPTVSAIPSHVDVAVVAVPADQAIAVVEDCAGANVHGLVIISAGFAEAGKDGQKLERRLLRLARDSGMRIVGPTSFGLINTAESVSMNASLAPAMAPAGHLGLFAQSGPLGIAVLQSAGRRSLGISTFASAGNRLDVSGNDLMQYWMDDDRTRAVGLYLESMGNPRKFSRIGRRLAMTKPVIVIKAGASKFGVPPGHRARVSEVDPVAFTAMLTQAGVIHVDNIHEMFDVAQILIHQPEPKGRRVAIVGNSVQLSALTAQVAESQGLQVTHGPASVDAEAPLDQFAKQVRKALANDEVDSVVVCFTPPLRRGEDEAVAMIHDLAADTDKTVVATMIGTRGLMSRDAPTQPVTETADDAGPDRQLPLYMTPEDAVRALAKATRYGEWRRKDKGTPLSRSGIERGKAQDIIDAHLAENPKGLHLSHEQAQELLAAYGIDLWARTIVASAGEAVAAAETLGYPVVVKSLSPIVRGQASLQGVRVDLGSATAVREAFESLDARLAAYDRGQFAVQRMAHPGVSTVVTGTEDPLFGPVVTFSVAGPARDLLEDIGYRIPPLNDVDVAELIDSIKAAPLLGGYKGAPPVSRGALAELIGRLSMLSDDMSEVASVILNPVVAHPGGVDVLGAEIELQHPAKRKDSRRRKLT
ncbi:bifunctional acetate--CoA ligase family protein/GNAT family N-acetyltransferase [Nostocoides australiense]